MKFKTPEMVCSNNYGRFDKRCISNLIATNESSNIFRQFKNTKKYTILSHRKYRIESKGQNESPKNLAKSKQSDEAY